MPRLPYLEDEEMTPEAREFISLAEKAGSPDDRVLRILFKSPLGLAWYRYWQTLSNEGQIPKALKELMRIKIAFDHTCGYCGTVRSNAAKEAGLTEERIQELWDFENSDAFSAREKLALRFCHYIKNDIAKADDDDFYALLRAEFNDAEIVEMGLWCAENVGAGSFVRTLNIITWNQACELNPDTKANSAPKTSTAA